MAKSVKELDRLLTDEDESSGESTSSSSEQRTCHNCGAVVPAEAEFCHKCGAKLRRESSCTGGRCCCCCAGTFICIALVIGILLLCLNHVVATSVTSVGSALLGVDVTLETVDINLLSCHVGLKHLNVNSPEGYEDKLLQLDNFRFDFDLGSVFTAYMADFEEPIILRSFEIVGLNVTVDMQEFPIGDSNAEEVVDHMNDVMKVAKDNLAHANDITGGVIPTLGDLKPEAPTPTIDQGVKAAYAMVKTDKIHFANISVGVRISTLPTIVYTMEEILLTDVGKEGKGVHVYELVDILIRAILMSAIRGAPASVRSNLAKAFGSGLWREMNFAALHLNLGQGMEELGNWVGWLTAESALLNTRMAVEGAALSANAAAMGAKLNMQALQAGTTMGTQAAALGAQATLAAANAQASATLQSSKLMADLTTGFTNGLTKALR